ncbi:uncharacterized protein LOC134839135 isoform X2 [Symsagittifera roscoffensis]|uniref:uncharacterized protein LOC134839135 isoform X2 n=1 Tax=Symsagittifera roscoffensis TaxID=84072 RepID=UPI00307B4412
MIRFPYVFLLQIISIRSISRTSTIERQNATDLPTYSNETSLASVDQTEDPLYGCRCHRSSDHPLISPVASCFTFAMFQEGSENCEGIVDERHCIEVFSKLEPKPPLLELTLSADHFSISESGLTLCYHATSMVQSGAGKNDLMAHELEVSLSSESVFEMHVELNCFYNVSLLVANSSEFQEALCCNRLDYLVNCSSERCLLSGSGYTLPPDHGQKRSQISQIRLSPTDRESIKQIESKMEEKDDHEAYSKCSYTEPTEPPEVPPTFFRDFEEV